MTLTQPESARRARLGVLKPNQRRVQIARKRHPDVPLATLRYLSTFEGMDAAQIDRYLTPYTYDELERDVLPRLNSLKDFEAAAQRIADAVIMAQSDGKAIGISGDYDCDGNCSTALMIRFLQESGVPSGKIHVHIPNRQIEGYGVNGEAVDAMNGKNVGLLLTLDNGTLAHKPLATARSLGMDVVVIDHHPNSADQALPDGALVVNPKRSDEPMRNDPDGVADMAAVGVSWLLCRRAAQLLEKRGYYTRIGEPVPQPRHWLGLVAMATVGDVVHVRSPLNRALVKEGLSIIREGIDPFITTLARVAQLEDLTQFSEEDVSFKLTPIINAPGRLWQSVAWAFLSPANSTSTLLETLQHNVQHENEVLFDNLTLMQRQLGGRFSVENKAHDRAISSNLMKGRTVSIPAPTSNVIDTGQYALMVLSNEANERRKLVETAVLRQARPMAETYLSQHPEAGTLLVAGEGWHEGVIGIVAGKLKEEFSIPSVVASIDRKTGLCKASARSVKSPDNRADIGQAMRDLCEKDNVLFKAGGHPMAAGASFEVAKLEAFRSGLEVKMGKASLAIRRMQPQKLASVIDLSRPLEGSNAPAFTALHEMVKAQEYLRPYGEGNAKPRIGLYGMRVAHVHRSRDGRHLFFELLPQVAYADRWVIKGQAFHAAGSEIEAKLLQAQQGKQDMEFLLAGTLATERAGREPVMQLRLDDILQIPIPASQVLDMRKITLAKALQCKPHELMGISTSPTSRAI